MSTRHIKKIYGSDIIVRKDENESASDAEDPVTGNVKSKAFNVFDVLNKNSDGEELEPVDQVISDAPCTDDVKRKKKKKRRRKYDNVKVQEQQKSESESEGEGDEIDRSLREVSKLLGEPLPSSSKQDTDSLQWVIQTSKESVLSVQHKHLNPYNELKKIFGSKTVQAEQSNRRRNRGRPGNLKKTWLVTPRETWPPITKFGLSMTVDTKMETTGDVQYFTYEHSSAYKQIQYTFLLAVENLNPENIVSIVSTHSYHVDALLQLAELCKHGEDLATAAEFTERALYCLEYAFHPLFNVTTANCRLDYRKQQNRALFITLFKHLGFVGGRACYRTSLEFCKLLLSLDPVGDPLAVVLSIDFYAIRAKEYAWFVEFCNLWESTRNLTQLPNIAYSLALAHFHLEDQEHADKLLQNALIMFPGVLMPLLDKCGVQPDSKVMSHSFFNGEAFSTTPPALEKLQSLYIARSFHSWKEPEILLWLEEGVHVVLDRIDAKDSYVKYCHMKRGKRYQGKLPRNILRHIVLADLKDVQINSQEIRDEGPILSYDPLPPTDSIDIYQRPTTSTRTDQSNSNLLSFFSTLLADMYGDVVAPLNGLHLFGDNDDDEQA